MNKKHFQTFLRAAATFLSLLSASEFAGAQCVSGLGATPYQLGSNDWSTAGFVVDTDLSASAATGYPIHSGSKLISDGSAVYLLDKSTGFVQSVMLILTDSVTPQPVVTTHALPGSYQFADIYVAGGILYGIGTGGNLRAFLPQSGGLGAFSAGVATGTQVAGMAFDGQYLWVSVPGHLLVLNPTADVSTAPSLKADYEVGNAASGSLLFDGQILWMLTGENLVKIDRNTGTAGQTIFGGITGPVLFDGSFMWVANGSNTLSKFDPSTGSVNVVPLTFAVAGFFTFDGSTMWTQVSGASSVGRVKACDASDRGSLALPGIPASEVYANGHVFFTYQNNSVVSVR